MVCRAVPVPKPSNCGIPISPKEIKRSYPGPFSHGPFEIVANFAAHKHVRSEKDIFSIEAMIENNVLRARKLLDLLLQSPPEHFLRFNRQGCKSGQHHGSQQKVDGRADNSLLRQVAY